MDETIKYRLELKMKLSHRLEFAAFFTFTRLFSFIGLDKTRRLANPLARVLFYFIKIRRQVVIANLRKAFPLKNDSEISEIAFQNYRNTLITFFEMMMLYSVTPKEILAQISEEDKAAFAKALDNSDPCLISTGHIGGWEFSVQSLPLFVNRNVNVLVRPQSNPLVTEWLAKARGCNKTKIVPAGVSVKELYNAIKKKELVIIAGDQRGEASGPRFNFFNVSTALYLGLATIAVKTECPIIAYAFVRRPDFSYKIEFEEIDLRKDLQSKQERILAITQKYISFIERVVQNNPEQYFWMHKLWKH